MGWNPPITVRSGRLLALFAALGFACIAGAASAQVGTNGFDPTTNTGATAYVELSNAYLDVQMGSGATIAGSFLLFTTASNLAEPGGPGGPAGAILGDNSQAGLTLTNLYLRVDGGPAAGGYDWRFGDLTHGYWHILPTPAGFVNGVPTQISAAWTTSPVTVTLPGATTTTAFDPQIEIDLTVSFVHDSCRFQFTVINPTNTLTTNATTGLQTTKQGTAHTIALAFTEHLGRHVYSAAGLSASDGQQGGLQIPNAPFLHQEALLTGSQVPQYAQFVNQVTVGTPATATTQAKPAIIHTARMTLKPSSSAETEPTPPTRFAFGYIGNLNGSTALPIVVGFQPNLLWSFTPNPADATQGSLGLDTGCAIYWDATGSVPAGSSITDITYTGQAISTNDFGQGLALSTDAPAALSYSASNLSVTQTQFVIGGYFTNKGPLFSQSPLPVNATATLTLPPGLKLADPTLESLQKPAVSVSPSQEGSVFWNVVADGTAIGSLAYTISTSANVGTAPSVTRSIDVPAPAQITLKGQTSAQGLFQMISLPFNFGNALPSTVLGPQFITSGGTPLFDLVQYDPVAGHYTTVNSLAPGQGYWIRSKLASDTTVPIIATQYLPVLGQTLVDQVNQTGNTTYSVTYRKGWNQVGNPYLYPIRFSEIEVVNPVTNGAELITAASSNTSGSQNQLLLPYAYSYNTSSADPTTWAYQLYTDFGFDMQPYQAYWLYFTQDNVQVIFTGTDIPGITVTKAAVLGVALGSQPSVASGSKWRAQVTMHGKVGADTIFIGSNPLATDGQDSYKFDKAPLLTGQGTLDIVHPEWSASRRLALDLRPPVAGQTVWNLTARSINPNETVTLDWAGLAASLPRNVRLTLVDSANNASRVMKTSSSYQFVTGSDGTRSLQIVAQPENSGPPTILSFNVSQPTGGGRAVASSVTLDYSLSQTAQVQFLVRKNNRPIRTLTPTTSGRAANGTDSTSGTAVWDLRDQHGNPLGAGVYTVELQALSATGQLTRQMQPFILSR